MDLNVKVVTTLSGVIDDAVSFETGLTRSDLASDAVCYDHHGQDFSSDDRGALPCFFEDLLLGRPMPPTFATPYVHDIDTLMAIALFLHRDLATHPNTPGFVSVVDFVHRRGLPALAHIEEPLARFLSALRAYFPENLGRRELGDRIVSGVGWLREYIHDGTIPVLGPVPSSDVRILDQGTGGFAVAETSGSLWDGWVGLYRLGFLRGVLVSTQDNDRKKVLIARKSHYVDFDLHAAARLLNQVEAAMGESTEWTVSRDELWLERPSATLILLKDVLAILMRV